MKFTATIELDRIQVLELIIKALEANGFKISHQDIEFKIQEVELGNQKYSWKTYEFAGAKIKNIQLGE